MDNQNYQEESDNNKEVQYSKDDKVKASLSIINKCSVINYKKAVEAMTSILYEDDEALNEFLQKIDQPADIIKEKTGEFLGCEYNRDGDSFRSNIDNAYYPITEDSKDLRYPSNDLREMELTFNKLFREYTKLYFGGGAICSCYIWNLEESIEKGICIAVIIKNIVDSDKGVKTGCWDSSHLIVVNFNNENNELQAKYKLTSTVFFSADLNRQNLDLEFSGSVTKLVS